MKIDWGKVIFWVIILAMLLIVLFGCNPVKQVLKDSAKMQQVFDEGVKLGWCVNDSVYVSDTTILLDTLHVIESTTDTLKVDSVVYITKTDYKTITKTVTIRDTTVVTDRSKEKLLQKEVSNLLDDQIKLKQDIVNIEAEKKAAKKSKNKAWTLFWIVLAACVGWTLRKPIMKLIKPI